MRPIAFIRTVACMAAVVACTRTYPYPSPAPPAPTPAPPPPRSSVTLSTCLPVAQLSDSVTVTDTTVTTTVSDGAGDSVAVPPRGAPLGTVIRLTRIPGPNRMVRAEPSNPVTGATVTLDFGGCSAVAANVRVAHVPSGGGPPEDVGGHVHGTEVTSDPLPHLSIYAVAAN
jgi:hypothetical protein